MKKDIFLRLGIVALAVGIIFSLMASRRQDKKIIITLTAQETDLVLRALGKLPLEESGNLFFNIQQQAQVQLMPKAAQKSDTIKPKKQ